MTAPVQLEIRPLRHRREFELALAIRREVFVREQGGPPEDEPDEWDACARHWLLFAGEAAVGTARLYHLRRGVGQLGRVAILPEVRGRGWGARLLAAVEEHARALGLRELVLNAQVDACPFYERFGYRVEGEEFIDAGIPHRRMVKALR